jgi:hypothetical protein
VNRTPSPWAPSAFETARGPAAFTFHAEAGGHDPQTRRSRPLSRRRAVPPRSASTEESVGIEPKARRLAQVSSLATAQPCSLSMAGNQGLEPCKAGFGDRPAPRALPMMIHEIIFRLCPGFRWSESNARLRVQSPPACHWPTPEWIPRQALTCNPRLGRPLHFARLGNRAPLRSRTGPSASSAQRSSHESLRGMCGTGMSRCFVSSSVVRERSKVG